MLNVFFSKKQGLRAITFIASVLILSLTLTSCEPLRKKFTRQKKKETESSELPILEPIEYPKKIYNAQELYKNNYMLFRAWYKELATNMSEDNSSKRRIYLLDQVVSNLTKMQELLLEEKQKVLVGYIGELKKIRLEFQKPVPAQSNSSLQIDLDSLERHIRKDYIFDKIKDNLKPDAL